MENSGRIDKRKRRRPTRSLSLADVRPESSTLRMTFLDDYHRNPSAYTQALLGTRCSAPPTSPLSSLSPVSQSPTPPIQTIQPVRRDLSAAIRRLFPSLDDPIICKMAAAKVPNYPPSRPHSPQPDAHQFNTDNMSREIFNLQPNTSTCSVKWAK
ncbi:hypothetical protein IW139_004893, partial [Coemansia sp. RSA 353]